VSKVFKSIGKIFKKVVKTVVKIAPFALAAAAVVFTGGAALGILPTFSRSRRRVGIFAGTLGGSSWRFDGRGDVRRIRRGAGLCHRRQEGDFRRVR
jgi:hypothetical protein